MFQSLHKLIEILSNAGEYEAVFTANNSENAVTAKLFPIDLLKVNLVEQIIACLIIHTYCLFKVNALNR